MPRKEGQVIARGESVFLIRLYRGEHLDPKTGKLKRRYVNETFHGTEPKAYKRLRDLLHDKDEGKLVEVTKLTLGQHLDHWLKRIRRRVQPQTLADYEEKLDIYVRPYVGQVKLASVTFEDLESYYEELMEKGLSARTVRYAHGLLTSAFEDAVKRRKIPFSPATYADAPRAERNEVEVLSEKEAQSFLKSAVKDPHGAIFILALTTGLRPEEYLGLLEKYLHLDRGVVEVQRVLVRPRKGGWELREPKTAKSRRNVKLPPQTVRALKEWHRRQAAVRLKAGASYEQNGFVFATPKGTPLHDRNLTLRHFRPLLEIAKLSNTHTLYTLRHTYATLSLAAGTHPKVVSKAFGHSSVAFTMDIYAHVLPSMQEAAAEKIAKLLFG